MKYLVILISFLLQISCNDENKPEILVKPPQDPKPKLSNCVIDDSLSKPRKFYYQGDTSKGVNTALVNYSYPFVAQTSFEQTSDMKLNFYSKVFFDSRNDYVVDYFNFARIPCTRDTVFLFQQNAVSYNLKLPVSIYSYAENDVLVERFDLDTTKRNYILITEFDTIQRIVKAEYWVQFQLRKPKYYTTSPDILRFCDGEIRIKY